MRRLVFFTTLVVSSCGTTRPDVVEMLMDRIWHLETRVDHLETEMALMKVHPQDDTSSNARLPLTTVLTGSYGPCPEFMGGPSHKCFYDGCNWCSENSCTTASCNRGFAQ